MSTNITEKILQLQSMQLIVSRTQACVVSGGLNRELISQLTFHSNKYACGKVDHSKGIFDGYGWTNINIAKMI